MEKKKSSHIAKGLVIALLLIVLDVVASFAGIKLEPWFRWIPTIIMAIAFIIACIAYSNEMDNRVTFGNVFGHGFKTSLVVASIFVIYTILSIYVIFPEQKDQIMQAQIAEMEKSNMTDEQKDQAVTMFNKMFVPIAFLAAVIGTLIVGAIASLLGAAFAKKKPITPFDQQTI